ncbi:UPF0481 protein At3g47200-like [Ziziphus jujuba]|uniref:UPF0481 protein At3g47200-like n=1 Tax=Ziziphus jujuba TaxID=326968 RepID=A0ABM4A2Z2_ZIZJJ|nr:UPF0481 protein At3g47200-like [Ziziphus jujuba]
MLRNLDKNNDCFDPHVVSVGPYHHEKPHLQEVENLKTEMALRYCGRFPGLGVSDLYKRSSDLYEIVKDAASEARGFYDKEILNNMDDKAFTKMMFLDGCFILEFIIMCLPMEEEGYHTNMTANFKRDLFLLENQLPCIFINAIEFAYGSSPKDNSPLHLLEVIQKPTIHGRKAKKSETNVLRGKPDVWFSRYPARVLKCIGILFGPNKTAFDWYSYHLARVLKSMGIHFRPNKTGSFSDMKFESRLFVWGVLTHPPIRIDASTKSLLLNLMGLESSHTNSADMRGLVTSYMCFMDSLIDNADNVIILRSQNIIVNCLGTDQDVADLFNNIASNLVPNPHIYDAAKHGIQKHCESKFKIWMEEFHRVHFKNPWTLFALFGSLLLPMLTVTQTYLAAMQLEQ